MKRHSRTVGYLLARDGTRVPVIDPRVAEALEDLQGTLQRMSEAQKALEAKLARYERLCSRAWVRVGRRIGALGEEAGTS